MIKNFELNNQVLKQQRTSNQKSSTYECEKSDCNIAIFCY